jgi:nucleoside-diphosphate kinase
MGATNPRKAAPGTIRYDFARDVSEEEMHKNAVHGSDSPEAAAEEIRFFFATEDICARS